MTASLNHSLLGVPTTGSLRTNTVVTKILTQWSLNICSLVRHVTTVLVDFLFHLHFLCDGSGSVHLCLTIIAFSFLRYVYLNTAVRGKPGFKPGRFCLQSKCSQWAHYFACEAPSLSSPPHQHNLFLLVDARMPLGFHELLLLALPGFSEPRQITGSTALFISSTIPSDSRWQHLDASFTQSHWRATGDWHPKTLTSVLRTPPTHVLPHPQLMHACFIMCLSPITA